MFGVVIKTTKKLFHEFKRLQLMIYLLIISLILLEVIGLGEVSGWRYRWHKANIIATSVIIAHFSWSQLIFYWDNRLAIENANDIVGAIKAAGMMIFRGIFYYAIIIAYTNGL